MKIEVKISEKINSPAHPTTNKKICLTMSNIRIFFGIEVAFSLKLGSPHFGHALKYVS